MTEFRPLKVSLGTGKNASGCRCCSEVFTSGSGFDKHWIGWAKRGGKCRPPAEVGLVQRGDGKWHFPGSGEHARFPGEYVGP